jgi:hypothetical protein
MTFRPTRRSALLGTAALGAGAALGGRPRLARAAARDRKFLFFFASGGWDTTQVFEPKFMDGSGADMAPDTALGGVGDLVFTAGDDRPGVSRFFSRWGHRSAIVNGVDTHSIGHGAGTRFMLTGSSASSLSDWPTLLASNTESSFPMPHVVFSGPSFGGSRGSSVVRGGGGRLLDLLDGSIGGRSDQPAPVTPRPVDSMVDAFVHGRVDEFARTQSGLGRVRAEALLSNLERSMELEGREFEAGLSAGTGGLLDRAIRATEVMRLGLTRCAMLGIPGGWDTHGDNLPQGPQFENFFDMLDGLMDHLATTPGHTAATLAEEVVIVAMSELGRTPRLNGGGGKDHWPFTSMLVSGPGVAGNQVLGATDRGLIGLPVDHATGRESSSGNVLGCESVGAALLTLGGVDPSVYLQDVQVLDALLR